MEFDVYVDSSGTLIVRASRKSNDTACWMTIQSRDVWVWAEAYLGPVTILGNGWITGLEGTQAIAKALFPEY